MRRFFLYAAAAVMAVSMIIAAPGEAWAAEETEAGSQAVESVYTEESGQEEEAVSQEEAVTETEAESEAEAEAKRQEAIADTRRHLVDYALQFVGNPYVRGGNDPHTGADCSGFIRYVMKHAAGISMYRSSREQSRQGTSISADQMQPGDLLFYGNGSRVNHVAMYIGDGRVVHASTERTGIKTSVWNYRTPVRIVSMFG